MKTKQKVPARFNDVILHQFLKLIARGMVNRITGETGIDAKARTFSVVSHLTAMLLAQLTGSISLNDVCDWLRMKAHVLIRHGLSAPSRIGLSHANRARDASFMEKLFWEQLGHLRYINSSFAGGRKGKGLLRRFKVRIHTADSTVIQLCANCMDWTKLRRHKPAAKMHLRLDLHAFLPSFAIVDTAAHPNNKRARE